MLDKFLELYNSAIILQNVYYEIT